MSLVESLAAGAANSQVLTSVSIEGFAWPRGHLCALCAGLQHSTTLQRFAFCGAPSAFAEGAISYFAPILASVDSLLEFSISGCVPAHAPSASCCCGLHKNVSHYRVVFGVCVCGNAGVSLCGGSPEVCDCVCVVRLRNPMKIASFPTYAHRIPTRKHTRTHNLWCCVPFVNSNMCTPNPNTSTHTCTHNLRCCVTVDLKRDAW